MAKIISLKIKCFLNKSFFKKTVLQMYLDEIVGYIIGEYYKQNGEHQKVMSRSKMPCTRCRCLLSATWRPGPCGTSSLCNACGLLYMIRNQRPRMIDLVISATQGQLNVNAAEVIAYNCFTRLLKILLDKLTKRKIIL